MAARSKLLGVAIVEKSGPTQKYTVEKLFAPLGSDMTARNVCVKPVLLIGGTGVPGYQAPRRAGAIRDRQAEVLGRDLVGAVGCCHVETEQIRCRRYTAKQATARREGHTRWPAGVGGPRIGRRPARSGELH